MERTIARTFYGRVTIQRVDNTVAKRAGKTLKEIERKKAEKERKNCKVGCDAEKKIPSDDFQKTCQGYYSERKN